jgi:hypothetical protein
MIPKKVYELCQSGQSVSAELAKDPTLSPHEAAKKIFGIGADEEINLKKLDCGEERPSDLEEARKCGNWGSSNPSDLFLRVRLCGYPFPHGPVLLMFRLQIYHNVLCSLEKNPLVGGEWNHASNHTVGTC